MHLDSDGFLSRTAALAAGFTDGEFRRIVASGAVRRITAGVYLPADRFDALTPTDRHRHRAIAAVRNRRGHAVSHTSAAVIHGLTMWNTDLGRVHLTTERASGGRKTSELHIHTAPLGPDSLTHAAAIPVTSAARTVVDTARTVDRDHAVVVGDSALRQGIVTPTDLSEMLGRSARMHNIAAARRAVSSMNGLSESAGESLSRLRFEQYRIPVPTLQYNIPVLDFRVDFFWEEFRIVGEFDGAYKYGGIAANLVREKEREDALRDFGYEVVRWVWKDLWNFAEVRMRFERARARALAR